jgi:hypothetical protein
MVANVSMMAHDLESVDPLAHVERATCAEGRCPDFDEPGCAVEYPGLVSSIEPPLSRIEHQRIVDVVGRGQNPRIVRIQDWSPNEDLDQPTPGANRVLVVTTWGGYNKCLHFGKNLGFVVERVGGLWRLVAEGASFVEYMH